MIGDSIGGTAFNRSAVLVARDTPLHPDRLEIVEAPPEILISAELMEAWRAGDAHPDVHLDGDVLTIDACNQRAVYVIGDEDFERDAYRARWPD